MLKSLKSLKLYSLGAIAGVATLCALGCSNGTQQEEVMTEPVLTPEPEIISIQVVEKEEPDAALPLPTVTPSPTPSVTEVPFSYYAPTVNMSYEELIGSSLDDVKKSGKELLKDGYPDPKTYYIIVDKQWQVVLVYKRIDDGTKFGKPDYDQPVRYMICSTGNPDREYGHDTTSGIWPIEIPKERFYQFVNLEAAQYLTLIHSRTYFHSVLYDKAKDLSTFIKQSYDDLGKKASHACIRLTVPDSCWMWYNIGYGTTCEIRDGSADDTVTGAIRAQLILPASKAKVSLKAGGVEWTDNWRIEDRVLSLPYKYQAAPKPDLGEGDDDTTTNNGTTNNPNATATPTPAGGGGTVVVPEPVITAAPVETPFVADSNIF